MYVRLVRGCVLAKLKKNSYTGTYSILLLFIIGTLYTNLMSNE